MPNHSGSSHQEKQLVHHILLHAVTQLMYCPSSDKDTILFPFIVHDGGVTDVTGAV